MSQKSLSRFDQRPFTKESLLMRPRILRATDFGKQGVSATTMRRGTAKPRNSDGSRGKSGPINKVYLAISYYSTLSPFVQAWLQDRSTLRDEDLLRFDGLRSIHHGRP